MGDGGVLRWNACALPLGQCYRTVIITPPATAKAAARHKSNVTRSRRRKKIELNKRTQSGVIRLTGKMEDTLPIVSAVMKQIAAERLKIPPRKNQAVLARGE